MAIVGAFAGLAGASVSLCVFNYGKGIGWNGKLRF